MRILLVDADDGSRARLRRMVRRLDAEQADVVVVGEACSGPEAEALCERLEPDVVVLDLDLPERTGMQTARRLTTGSLPPALVLCASDEVQAVSAMAIGASAYLVKPVRGQALEQALERSGRLNRAQLATLARRPRNGGSARTHISARIRRGIELVPVDEIRYFQADQKYVTVRWPEGELLIDEPLRQLETEFGDRFVRIHRNALVSVRHLETLERDGRGHHYVRMRGIDDRLDVSRRHVPGLRRFLQTL